MALRPHCRRLALALKLKSLWEMRELSIFKYLKLFIKTNYCENYLNSLKSKNGSSHRRDHAPFPKTP